MVETHPNGMRKKLIWEKGKNKSIGIIKQHKNAYLWKRKHNVVKVNIKEHNPNWPQIPDHPHRILINGGCRTGKWFNHYLIN